MPFKWMPFLVNFNRKRGSIILKKSKGRRNPIVNFIYFFLLSFIEIYKKLHICNVYILMSLEIHKHLSYQPAPESRCYTIPSASKDLACSHGCLVCLLGALFLTLRSTLF